jgi:formyltetrahydrofolate-dependent phosphoribosylglycinamide formyltransferase
MPRIAIFLSGRGTNMQALLQRIRSGDLEAEIVFVASDNPEAAGLALARSLGIETRTYSYRLSGRVACEEAMTKDLEEGKIDWIVLAGFMKILSPGFVSRFSGRIVNIHPSLLPAFPGTDAIGQAWRYGVRVTGVTVHLVDERVDHGPILAQEAIHVEEKETLESLESRTHEVEHRMYWQTLRNLFEGKFKFSERGPGS